MTIHRLAKNVLFTKSLKSKGNLIWRPLPGRPTRVNFPIAVALILMQHQRHVDRQKRRGALTSWAVAHFVNKSTKLVLFV